MAWAPSPAGPNRPPAPRRRRSACAAPAHLLKFAFTDWLPLMVTAQVGWVPAQAPPQLEKAKPAGGVAVSVSAVPGTKLAAQATLHWMPAGVLTTVPVLPKLTDKA